MRPLCGIPGAVIDRRFAPPAGCTINAVGVLKKTMKVGPRNFTRSSIVAASQPFNMLSNDGIPDQQDMDGFLQMVEEKKEKI